MKHLITLLLLLPFACFAQLIQDKTIKSQYDRALEKASPELQAYKTEIERTGKYLALGTVWAVDTLNKAQLDTSFRSVKLYDVDTGKESVVADETIKFPFPWAASGVISKDTLIIHTALLFPGSLTKIYRSKINTVWQEYRRHDNVFRLNLKQKKVGDLNVPTQSKLTLSNTHPKVGDVIYGKLELKTIPYYIDDYLFTSKYIHQTIRFTCYFKIKIEKQ